VPSVPSQPAPPTVEVTAATVADVDARVLVMGFSRSDDDYLLSAVTQEALDLHGVDGFALLDRAMAKGAAGETVSHEIFSAGVVERLVLVGLGDETGRDYRRAGAAVARIAKTASPVATAVGALADDEGLDALVEGLVLGAFGFTRKREESAKPVRAPVVVLTNMPADRSASRQDVVDRATWRAKASWRARSFALTPSNEKSPVRLVEWSREAARHARLDVDVWDEKRLGREGFGGILAVGAGSTYESRFIRLDYAPRPSRRRTPRVVLVGKGITFDTGGLSIKPRDAMMTMKRDMTGAGVVIAVMGALRDLKIDVAVTGLAAAAENAVGANAMRPGDVITHYGGRTSEVGNTDAEGRLVLADALAYADANLEADVVVDIATLTGAAKVALGTTLGALYANDDPLAAALLAAGERAGEPMWRLPLSQEYEVMLENTFADATNAAGSPGSITAALYLQHFVGSRPWAHLDIASVGDSPKDAFEYTQGATGFGARLLLQWLAGLSASEPGAGRRRRGAAARATTRPR